MSTTIAAQMPAVAFCYGNKEQLACLARLDLHTIGDMWRYIQGSTPPVHDSDLAVAIHKRHVIARNVGFGFGFISRL